MLGRLTNLFRGAAGLFVSGLEKKNPEAMLAAEQDTLRQQVAKFNQSLVAHAALVEKLIAQVRKSETDEADLRAKTAANLKLGNREAAGQYALRLQGVGRALADDRMKMGQAEETYKNLVRARDVAVSTAKGRIEALKAGISDLRMRQAMAELTEMATGMVGSRMTGSESLGRLEEMVNEERYKAAGRVRVAVDSVDAAGVQMQVAEKGALAEQALEAFEAEQGAAKELGAGTPVPGAGIVRRVAE